MYHVVWIPKYRYKVLIKDLQKYFEDTIKSVCVERYPDVLVEEIKTMVDHVHIVIIIPPKYSVSNVVGDLKRNSSRELRKRFEYLRRGKDSLWSIGYYVSSVGLDEARIKKYVQYQEEQDSGRLKAVFD
jgi:putative transposase